ncbi:class I SAM-dependent methyltransferase [Sphingomonas alpina]|uniref:Class I SAM-dependent methyltransferase n=1 Tax=Sphingomonas alpina TaxID=653931 RepID=A0A7H0LFK8_9SPHN|nr:class I SAM-dependent methyltransferase [Sphingomonas alpina]QNQ08461.1 class I SAM-dependent methyltransferase [Sphingomonas alpina]
MTPPSARTDQAPRNQAPSNQAQAELWNARAGETWVAQQAMLDRLFLPLEELLADSVRPTGARDVLDIGCGAGATTLAVAQALAPDGQCTGLDISVPLIEAARRRAAETGVATQFLAGDAQNYSFARGSFDWIVSRFGVMFFDQPEWAFANLRGAVRDGAGLTMITWRDPAENPFMTAGERAAAPLLPQLTPSDPDAPGQFAFADPDKVRRILANGWRETGIKPVDIACALPAGDLRTYIMNMGRVGVLLPDLDDRTRASVSAALTAAFDPFISNGVARFSLACWLVTARAA